MIHTDSYKASNDSRLKSVGVTLILTAARLTCHWLGLHCSFCPLCISIHMGRDSSIEGEPTSCGIFVIFWGMRHFKIPRVQKLHFQWVQG